MKIGNSGYFGIAAMAMAMAGLLAACLSAPPGDGSMGSTDIGSTVTSANGSTKYQYAPTRWLGRLSIQIKPIT